MNALKYLFKFFRKKKVATVREYDQPPEELIMSTVDILLTKIPFKDFENWNKYKMSNLGYLTTEKGDECKIILMNQENNNPESTQTFEEGEQLYFTFRTTLFNPELAVITKDIFFTSKEPIEFNPFQSKINFHYSIDDEGKPNSKNNLDSHEIKRN